MATFKSDLLNALSERGLVYQHTDLEALDKLAATETITGYCGFDCTADSLHIGNLLPITMLRWLQKTGHRPIALVGGATTKIGDPSGKDETRKILTDEQLQTNINGIKKSLGKFLDFGDGEKDAIIVNNNDWLGSKDYIPFLQEVGHHFTVNRMLTFESVKRRLDREQPLTFLEFNYMIFQAYDFMHLNDKYNCVLQLSGSDQYGNIVNGVELTRRMKQKTVYGLSCALITTASGAKMGKSVDGAVWLNEERKSPYDYWQFWRNTEDADVGKFLRLFTDLPIAEIEKLEKLGGAEINEAKKILADEATKLCHGEDEAAKAAQTAAETFAAGGGVSAGLPQIDIATSEVQGLGILDALLKVELVSSKGEARRLIKGGGAKVNDTAVADENAMLSADDIQDGVIKLSAGKKKHVLLKVS